MTAISRGLQSFHPVDSTEPALLANSSTSSAALYALESTATARYWRHGASGRAVRVSSITADDYYITFGTSDAVCTSSGGMQMLGGTVETFLLRPGQSHISTLSTVAGVSFSVVLGYGQ